MIYQAGELLAYLKNLQLCGQDEEGDLEWIGERQDFDRVDEEIEALIK